MISPEYSSRQEQPTRKTILIIEDDEAIGYFLTTAIQTETPYLPLFLPNGNQALQQIREKKPDLLLLDYHLPGINGIDLYDQLQAMNEISNIPAILLTANTSKQMSNEAERRKLTILTKPLELDDFLHLVGELLA
jgi:CheY-like chemotaxis protein